MAEKKSQVDLDEWSKDIAKGLENVGETKALDVGKETPPITAGMGIPTIGMGAAIGALAGKIEPQKVVLSGGEPMPGLDTMPALNTTHVNLNQNDSGYLEDPAKFEHMQRVAKLFSASKILPEIYRGDVASCFVAVHMAARMQIDPFTFMQNSYVVQGKPALEGKLMIAVLNARGGYIDGIEYEYSGEGDDYGCRAFGTLRNGKVHEARVDIKLAKAEGWYAKNPKWRNMPDQMLAYRSAAFLLRKYRPELIMGLQTYEEIADVGGVVVQAPVGSYRRSDLNDSLEEG